MKKNKVFLAVSKKDYTKLNHKKQGSKSLSLNLHSFKWGSEKDLDNAYMAINKEKLVLLNQKHFNILAIGMLTKIILNHHRTNTIKLK